MADAFASEYRNTNRSLNALGGPAHPTSRSITRNKMLINPGQSSSLSSDWGTGWGLKRVPRALIEEPLESSPEPQDESTTIIEMNHFQTSRLAHSDSAERLPKRMFMSDPTLRDDTTMVRRKIMSASYVEGPDVTDAKAAAVNKRASVAGTSTMKSSLKLPSKSTAPDLPKIIDDPITSISEEPPPQPVTIEPKKETSEKTSSETFNHGEQRGVQMAAFAMFNMAMANPNGEVPNPDIMLRSVWPHGTDFVEPAEHDQDVEKNEKRLDKNRRGEKSVDLLGPSEHGGDFFRNAERPRQTEVPEWYKTFSAEMEAEFQAYYFPFFRRQFQRLYIICFLYTAIASLYYAPLFTSFPNSPANWTIFLVGFIISLFGLLSTKFRNVSPAWSLHLHMLGFGLFGLLMPFWVYIDRRILPHGVYYLWSFILYTTILLPVKQAYFFGYFTSICSWLVAVFLSVYQQDSFLECWQCAKSPEINTVISGYEVLETTVFPLWSRLVASFMLYGCINLCGGYYSKTVDLFARKTFCKQRLVIEKHEKLILAKLESDRIALSILPQKVWNDLRSGQHQRYVYDGSFHRSLMYRHEQVTVLFADIVGFTALSSRMNAEELVDMLNNIFFAFDSLMDKFPGLEKIKTLGDCYVLCAGVPRRVVDHALRVVAMGLDMTKTIREISIPGNNNNSVLEIRVGIHSGWVMAGLIGTDKLTFDIWSEDVTIASLMEKTSEPSRVHVSEATHALLDDMCECVPGPEVIQEDSGSNKHLIRTFFVNKLKKPLDFGKSQVGGPYQSFARRISKMTVRNVLNFGQNSIYPKHDMKGSADDTSISPLHPGDLEPADSIPSFYEEDDASTNTPRSRSIALKTMHSASSADVGTNEAILLYSQTMAQINFISLTFKDPEMEFEYYNGYVGASAATFFSAIVVTVAIELILLIENGFLLLAKNPQNISLLMLGQVCVMVLQLPILFLNCMRFFKRDQYLTGTRIDKLGANFFQASAVSMLFLLYASAMIYTMEVNQLDYMTLSDQLFVLDNVNNLVLVSLMTFSCFIRLRAIWVQLLSFVILVSYVLVMAFFFGDQLATQFYEPFIYIGFLVYCLAVVARRIEIFVRRNYLMKRLLVTKKFEIEDIQVKTQKLLLNLLPRDIVSRLKDFHDANSSKIADEIPQAAVLFCCIVNFTHFDGESMRILNELVSKFDHATVNYSVEKIKIIGNTYMAATGIGADKDENFLVNLVNFALALQEKMSQFNREMREVKGSGYEDYLLRMGIEVGPVVAGVIGRTKFAYDIWGLTVNVASRMESTGVAGNIQVTERVCNQLKGLYILEPRGEVYAKGAGKMMTYFVKGRNPDSEPSNLD